MDISWKKGNVSSQESDRFRGSVFDPILSITVIYARLRPGLNSFLFRYVICS